MVIAGRHRADAVVTRPTPTNTGRRRRARPCPRRGPAGEDSPIRGRNTRSSRTLSFVFLRGRQGMRWRRPGLLRAHHIPVRKASWRSCTDAVVRCCDNCSSHLSADNSRVSRQSRVPRGPRHSLVATDHLTPCRSKCFGDFQRFGERRRKPRRTALRGKRPGRQASWTQPG